MKFAKGGIIEDPGALIVTGEGDGIIAADQVNVEHLGDLFKALSLDALLLELEESLRVDME